MAAPLSAPVDLLARLSALVGLSARAAPPSAALTLTLVGLWAAQLSAARLSLLVGLLVRLSLAVA